MSFHNGAAVKFDRPGSADSAIQWEGVVEKVEKDGNLLVRDQARKLRVVPQDSRWLTEVTDAHTQSAPSGNRS